MTTKRRRLLGHASSLVTALALSPSPTAIAPPDARGEVTVSVPAFTPGDRPGFDPSNRPAQSTPFGVMYADPDAGCARCRGQKIGASLRVGTESRDGARLRVQAATRAGASTTATRSPAESEVSFDPLTTAAGARELPARACGSST